MQKLCLVHADQQKPLGSLQPAHQSGQRLYCLFITCLDPAKPTEGGGVGGRKL